MWHSEIVALSITTLCRYVECRVLFINILNSECRYAECRYAECHDAVIIATWFVLVRPFQPSLMFMGKAGGAYLGPMF